MANQQIVSLARNPDFVLTSPLSVPVTKSKKFILNLNVYRNAHYFTLNTAKQNYKEIIQNQIEGLPGLNTAILVYVLYPKRICDVTNVCCVHSKFFLDALVESGKLKDDDMYNVPTEIFMFAEVDKVNPRVEIRIYENCI